YEMLDASIETCLSVRRVLVKSLFVKSRNRSLKLIQQSYNLVIRQSSNPTIKKKKLEERENIK
ncbi:MAG: hypothetical protein ACI83B_003563, partial [Sediminicola sp.]